MHFRQFLLSRYAISAKSVAFPFLIITWPLTFHLSHRTDYPPSPFPHSYIIGLFLAPAIQAVCENQQMFLLYMTGTRMRNALMAAIYRKCLRLSNAALQVRC